MPISGCHDLPLATFNLPSRSAATMSLPQQAANGNIFSFRYPK